MFDTIEQGTVVMGMTAWGSLILLCGVCSQNHTPGRSITERCLPTKVDICSPNWMLVNWNGHSQAERWSFVYQTGSSLTKGCHLL